MLAKVFSGLAVVIVTLAVAGIFLLVWFGRDSPQALPDQCQPSVGFACDSMELTTSGIRLQLQNKLGKDIWIEPGPNPPGCGAFIVSNTSTASAGNVAGAGTKGMRVRAGAIFYADAQCIIPQGKPQKNTLTFIYSGIGEDYESELIVNVGSTHVRPAR